jgi:hypothetical protein
MSDDNRPDNDYEFLRQTYYGLIQKGSEGIEEMMEVARHSEHPRAYEVLSKLIKDVGDVSEKLLAISKTHKDIKAPTNQTKALPDQSTTTNNNLFVGSTAELQKMLRLANEKEVSDSQDDEI